MNARQQRLVGFANAAVAIEYAGQPAASVVDFLYRHAPGAGGLPPRVTYRIACDEAGHVMRLYREGTLLYQGSSAAALAELLQGEVCYQLAFHSQGGLVFHAAGLAWQGQGLLVPGSVGAGKTTLAAWLATKGFDYLTDELIFVAHGADRLQAFTRPLNVKKGARLALQGCFDFEGQAAHVWSTPRGDLIPPHVLRPNNTLSEPRPALILFPRYAADAAFAWQALSKAQAGLALMQCLVNARSLPGFGLSEIARLAQCAPACRVHYADFEQLEECLDRWLGWADAP